MREIDIRKKYKISPLTFAVLKNKFKGKAVKARGRVSYPLEDYDKVLLRVSPLDPYTFRERFKLFVPYHRIMVYLCLTHSTEEIVDYLVTRKVINVHKTENFVSRYRYAVLSCLPDIIKRWLMGDQDIPLKHEPWVKGIFKVLDMYSVYTNPDLLDRTDAILLTPELRSTLEIIATTNGNESVKYKAVTNLCATKMSMADYRLYIHMNYDTECMVEPNWKEYMTYVTQEDKKYKCDAYGSDIEDYLLRKNLLSGLDLDEYLKGVAEDCKTEIKTAVYRPPEEGLRIRESAIKTIMLIKNNLPNIPSEGSTKDSTESVAEELRGDTFAEATVNLHAEAQLRVKKSDTTPGNMGFPEGKEIV